jgi:phospholipid/cholesterol/gamma-HCH transport system ATP-binding protein
MFYPFTRLEPGESQILFDGPPSQLDQCVDQRVRQFVHGEAGERLMELIAQQADPSDEPPLMHDPIARRKAK